MSSDKEKKRSVLKSFKPVFWLVIVFEFFERGSYYGVMSVLSVYLTDILHFAKEDVGLIKGTIQPLLYFLPIIAGALADRFGYKNTLLVAFSLLGGGYFLSAQVTSYSAVFLALCVMGLGAGAFKPIISGTIARITDKSNSTLGFGIYYWSINLGAFLVPLFLVPYLKNNIGWDWVLYAAAIGTGAMIIPTLLFYKEPAKEQADEDDEKPKTSLFQTLANAFEIIYSPVVLTLKACRTRKVAAVATSILMVLLVSLAVWQYARPRSMSLAAPGISQTVGNKVLEVQVVRNLNLPEAFQVEDVESPAGGAVLVVHRPDEIDGLAREILPELEARGLGLTTDGLIMLTEQAVRPPQLHLVEDRSASEYGLEEAESSGVTIRVHNPDAYVGHRDQLLSALREMEQFQLLPGATLDELFSRGSKRPFLLVFIALLLLASALALSLQRRYQSAGQGGRAGFLLATALLLSALIWLLPGLTLFARIVSTVISLTVLSMYLLDLSDTSRFRDHARFLLLIFLYSGFWVLYFQMFDSVLWYVQSYVDASSINAVVNSILGAVGLDIDWRFDVEHVTVVNAGAIIMLQLLISQIVAKTRALPTMITGIAMGSVGMAILAISANIWVFIAGIVIFSVGEMTAHPKFVSYIGQIAPRDRVATYMGYIFLYGVIGASIGAVVGAKLYVQLVDNLNQPRLLWIIFSLIGVATIIALFLYNRFTPEQGEYEG